ncbi:MAG: hypothetical protein H6621_03400 [Halobacteriovoraceae bacterium]|nr:hypothetical protein [Halobacteriovoraceae bacterium]MCB9094093.1 hypothetical protein [Halobacteriovoraceae bacterium]
MSDPKENEEKNFNDDELANIMSEIESLESEIEEQHASSDEEESKVVAKKDNVKPISKPKKEVKQDFEEEDVPTSDNYSQLNFNVEGNMKLDMSFLVNGKSVFISIDGKDEGLVIEMEDGLQLRLPFHTDDIKKVG